MACLWEFAMKNSRQLLPYIETAGYSVGSPLLPNMKKLEDRSEGSGVGCPWEYSHANYAVHYFQIWKQWTVELAANGMYVEFSFNDACCYAVYIVIERVPIISK